ncbi:CRISPR-associated RAMP Crm2 family protein [Candidatus Magnetomorum sp. HK-1]|nr:CRISPR-associated RAMP Crm2 family protein [Candidatus Magnetomorum sp. HK-1]
MQEQNSSTYAGLTIGPISDVMRHSKKTKEQWFGSYLFSWYMERVMKAIAHDLGANVFLTPHYDPQLVQQKDNPIKPLGGKYPDRFVLKTNKPCSDVFKSIETACNDGLDFFSKMIISIIHRHQLSDFLVDESEIFEIIKNYIQIRFFCLTSSDFFAHYCPEKDLPVDIAYDILDSLESSFIFKPGKSDKTCDVCKTLSACAFAKDLYKDKIEKLCPLCYIKRFASFNDDLKKRILHEKNTPIFPSVKEIAINELSPIYDDLINKCKDKEDDIDLNKLHSLLKANKTISKDDKKTGLKKYHKYFAIVQADGDNLGKLAKDKDMNPQKLSKSLFDFAAKTEELINDYGGYPVFLGGDDILAYMPVCYQGTTVIDFIKEISSEYKKIVDNNKNKTSISFGLNIVYNKFPLARALENVSYLLFDKAKKIAGKNCMAVCQTMHSGSKTQFTLQFDSDKQVDNKKTKLEAFSDMISNTLDNERYLPRGIAHNLERFKKIIAKINNTDRLKAFFDNTLNEPVFMEYSDSLQMLLKFFETFLFTEKDKDQAIDNILNMLYFIKFITDEADHE